MPIPPFDSILNILPPHLGDPRDPSQMSPYPCTTGELCQRFATSTRRSLILDGFLRFRKELFGLGIQGFQWLDGSFLEDVETQEGRDPRDIDVVTFVSKPIDLGALAKNNAWFLNRNEIKTKYSVDHFLVPLASAPHQIVDLSRYWYGLFSHRRDRLWKGMLTVGLVDQHEDSVAMSVLGGTP